MQLSIIRAQSIVDFVELFVGFGQLLQQFVLQKILITAFSPENHPLFQSVL